MKWKFSAITDKGKQMTTSKSQIRLQKVKKFFSLHAPPKEQEDLEQHWLVLKFGNRKVTPATFLAEVENITSDSSKMFNSKEDYEEWAKQFMNSAILFLLDCSDRGEFTFEQNDDRFFETYWSGVL